MLISLVVMLKKKKEAIAKQEGDRKKANKQINKQ